MPFNWVVTETCVCVFQATEEGGETVACYSVCVSLVEGEETVNSRWSVQRKLTEFQMLHRKLTEVTRHCVQCIATKASPILGQSVCVLPQWGETLYTALQ